MQVKYPKTFSSAGTCSKEEETKNIHSLDAVVSQICCSAKKKSVILKLSNAQQNSGVKFFLFQTLLDLFIFSAEFGIQFLHDCLQEEVVPCKD